MSDSQAATDNQKKMLAGLMAILALVFIWQIGYPALKGWLDEGAASRKASRQASRVATITQRTVERVRMEDLQREGATYRPQRNIFRYAPPKPVAPPPRPAPTPRAAPPPPPPPRPAPPPPAGPVPPPVEFTVLGLFGPEDGRIAVLVDGEEIINARVNEVVKDDFVIDDIGFEVVDIGFVNFPDTAPVRLEIEGKAARKGGGGGGRGGGGRRGARERGRRGR